MKKLNSLLAGAAILLAGCGTGDKAPFTNGLVAPFLFNDSYKAISGATVQVAADKGILANDFLNGNVYTGFGVTTDQGGTLFVNDDGSFSYTPAPGFTGIDTATYSLLGNTATITFNVDRRAFFVNNTVASSGDGTQAAPFQTLAEGLAAATQANDIVFVFSGTGDATGLSPGGTITLAQTGQSLVGEGAGLSTAEGTVVPAGNFPALVDPVLLDKANTTLSGIQITGAATAVTVTAPAIVQKNKLVGATTNGVTILDANGAVSVADNEITNFGTNGLLLSDTAAGTTSLTIQNNKFDINANSGQPLALVLTGANPITTTVNITGNTATATAGNYNAGGLTIVTNTGQRLVASVESNRLEGLGTTGLVYVQNGNTVNDVRLRANEFRAGAGAAGVAFVSNNGGGLFVATDNIFQGDVLSQVVLNNAQAILVGLRGNTFQTSASVAASLLVVHNGAGTAGLDFTGNNLDQLQLVQGGAAGTFSVEQLAQLIAGQLNTFANATPTTTAGTITDVGDGTLNIP